jgi:hypothetical protein
VTSPRPMRRRARPVAPKWRLHRHQRARGCPPEASNPVARRRRRSKARPAAPPRLPQERS